MTASFEVTILGSVTVPALREQPAFEEGDAMSTEQNKALVRRLDDEANNKHNLSVIDELVAEDVLFHLPSGDERPGLAAIKEDFVKARESYPDRSVEIGLMIAEGDRVAYLWTDRATFSRDRDNRWGHFPANGRVLTGSGITICRIADGRVVEVWEVADNLHVLEQMGGTLMPPTDS